MIDSFDSATNFPYPSPTAPAPGPSLLDDTESKFLDSFFDGVSSADLNYDFFTNAPGGTELGLGWDEVPPTFMGTTTSFGQQPQLGSHGLPPMTFGDMSHMNNVPTVPPSTSADLMAAATLMQTAPNGRAHSLNGMGNGVLYRTQSLSMNPSNGLNRTHSISQFPIPRTNSTPQESVLKDNFMRDNFYTDMMFGSSPEESMRPRHLSQVHSKADIRWGSDTGFGAPTGFIPPETQRKEEAKMDYPFKIMEMGFIESPTSTRPSSPSRAHAASPKKPRFSMNIKYDDESDLRPRKRRKSRYQEDDEDDESPASNSKSKGKKRKSTTADDDTLASEAKRRKSSAAAAVKATRENLTEDQKRENHIKSEQKRRTLIREGFEDLGELVPGLHGGGFSKSAVLIMSADWLEDLIQGNDILRQRLAQLQGR